MSSVSALEPQSMEWRRSCRQLAERHHLIGTAQSLGGERDSAWQPPDLYVYRWEVPSGSEAGTSYVVSEARCADPRTQREYYALQCTCRAGAFQKPCKHIGAALSSVDNRPPTHRVLESEARP